MTKISRKLPESPYRKGRRNADYVSSVVLRMGNDYKDHLDSLCQANDLSRREIIEILINEAWQELQSDPQAQINPL